MLTNEQLNQELENRKQELIEARNHGDLSENSEYQIAMERYAIQKAIVENYNTAQSYAKDSRDHHRVELGAKITIKDIDTGAIESYTFVPKEMVDPLNDLLSTDCPLFKATQGLYEGDEAVVNAKTVNRLSILSIQ